MKTKLRQAIFVIFVINCLCMTSLSKSLKTHPTSNISGSQSSQKYPTFAQFKTDYNKTYSNTNENKVRQAAYNENVAALEQ